MTSLFSSSWPDNSVTCEPFLFLVRYGFRFSNICADMRAKALYYAFVETCVFVYSSKNWMKPSAALCFMILAYLVVYQSSWTIHNWYDSALIQNWMKPSAALGFMILAYFVVYKSLLICQHANWFWFFSFRMAFLPRLPQEFEIPMFLLPKCCLPTLQCCCRVCKC